jgi:methyl-accepting chemotaxis protein
MEVNLKTHSQTISLAKINEMTEEIKTISDIITNISGQTNLLALNASIEAGRAGAYGLGFAVVAEKVQKLAEEAKSSVGKTSEIVAKISARIKQAATDSVEISSAMEEISSSAQEQTASMEEISATADNLGIQAEELKTQLSAFENMK